MEVGVVAPQGWTGEYRGLSPADAWARVVAVTRRAEALGFESVWLFDHLHTEEETEELTFEGWSSLAALAALTERVRLGHLVSCVSYRNPALTAKMAGTLDVISGGRAELGLGAGWHRGEHEAYGYGFPSLRERQTLLEDALEISTRMLRPGRATYEGRRASVRAAINAPSGLQAPRIPIIVGGNGQQVTWRLAARYADELNLDGPTPAQLRDWMPVIRRRCAEVGRDPDGLRVSAFVWWGNAPPAGRERVDWLEQLAALGVARVMWSVVEASHSDEPLALLAEDVGAAGLAMRAAGR
jgi:F420-dependent oxidoreductase-like protein